MIQLHVNKATEKFFVLPDELKFLKELGHMSPILVLYSRDNIDLITSEVKELCPTMVADRLLPHTILIIQKCDVEEE